MISVVSKPIKTFQEEVMSQKINRRKFLQVSAAGAAGLIIASCAPATVAPTTAPAADTPVPAAANTPTPIPTISAATSTPVPTVAASKYKEAPALADLVKAGKLPSVDQRLPSNPLVLSPIDAIGKFGGRIRQYYGYEGYFEEGQYGHSPLRWVDDGMGIAAGLCDKWSANADNSVWTLHMREGVKWSDGQPADMNDVMFWWNNMTTRTDSANIDVPSEFCLDGTKLVTFTLVDNYTLTLTYTAPAPLTLKRLAMWVKGNIGPRWIVPAHYIKQFIPKLNPAMTDMKTLQTNVLFRNNPDCPTLDAWMTTKYAAGTSRTSDRNPYYYAVDTEGNQLPYIDGCDETSVTDPQVRLLQIRQGTVDFQNFTDLTLADISTLKDNQDAGGYDVFLWDTGSGTSMMYFWNYDYPDTTPEDKKVHDLFRNPKFKQAMSFALDRPTIQTSIYYGQGILTTGTMSPKAFEFNFNADAQAFGKKARDLYAAYDPAKAKQLLLDAGLKVGADGKVTYGDGSKLEIRMDLPGDASKECTDVLDIATKNWAAVGLSVIANQVTPTAFDALWKSGKGQIHTNWEVGDGPDHLLYPSWVVPNENTRWAPLCGNLILAIGTPGETTEADKSPWDRQPPRYNVNDPEYKGTPIEQIHKLYNQAVVEPDETKRASIVWSMWQIHEDQGPFFIGTVANPPRPIIVSRKLTNVPTHDQLKLGGFVNPWILPYPAIINPETFSYK
jgi:peptide/nickel transport system substrate-binding protein